MQRRSSGGMRADGYRWSKKLLMPDLRRIYWELNTNASHPWVYSVAERELLTHHQFYAEFSATLPQLQHRFTCHWSTYSVFIFFTALQCQWQIFDTWTPSWMWMFIDKLTWQICSINILSMHFGDFFLYGNTLKHKFGLCCRTNLTSTFSYVTLYKGFISCK